MIEVNIKDLKAGALLAEDVKSSLGGAILYKDTRIEEYHKELLNAFTISSVKIVEEKKTETKLTKTKLSENKKQKSNTSDNNEPTLKKPAFKYEEFEKQYNKAVGLLKNVMLEVEYTRKVPLLEIRSAIKPMLENICDQPNITLVLDQIKSKEAYTYQHLVGVGVLSTLIARFMNYKENELMQIGLAGTLHDIGKAKISDSILRKKGPLNHIEYEEIKKHPIYSYEILENVTGINQGVVLAALEHHERDDGFGYPYKRKGFEMHPYSKIVAVADIFHAMTSNREYKNAENIYHVLKQINQDAFGKLDPKVVTSLINGLLNYCIGKSVELNNGTKGEIIFINSTVPLKPLIKVGNEFIDLNKRTDIAIEKLTI
ncbi:HD-GYP domain-containing protein [Desulfuribacillus alkaliarsenatis]|uniref:Uncharacterized protein n=1 Tax=Desulfuribacillus alkaliarsenatis TaxID=766136 RepID=A0A1E5G2K8_9FIRM|nr:HD-GYP domain-containing protein [Desulfuribacillus alkaliarsenatis]OEF97307.1 hypothetical protein BHF68_03555 [Desulfuribacillus alkaliarsenatis]